MNKKEFLNAAQKGAVTVTFKKIGTGEIRVMPCTLNRDLSEQNVPEKIEQNSDSEHFAVWAIDKKAWRSFRVDTVVDWQIGLPEEMA
jgi:hypothetical protein